MKQFALLLSLFFLLIAGCYEKKTSQVLIEGYEPEQQPIRISISDLVTDYRLYDGRFIETSGFFSHGFEDFAIYTQKSSPSESNKGFWLGLNSGLKLNYESLEKLNGKKVTIRGVVDISNKGHLSSYLATIKEIYYISYK